LDETANIELDTDLGDRSVWPRLKIDRWPASRPKQRQVLERSRIDIGETATKCIPHSRFAHALNHEGPNGNTDRGRQDDIQICAITDERMPFQIRVTDGLAQQQRSTRRRKQERCQGNWVDAEIWQFRKFESDVVSRRDKPPRRS